MVFTGTRKAVAAALAIGVIVGGGMTVVAPAVASQDASYAATNWKKIWKKKLQRYADKRYYTKKKARKKFATKAELGGYYTKAQSDANYYTKAQSDAKYTPYTLIRGTTIQSTQAAGAGDNASDSIAFGVTLSAAPTVNYIPIGGVNPPGCTGTAGAPNAAAGNLCVYEVFSSNNTGNNVVDTTGAPGSTTFGAVLFATSAGPGQMVITTNWALRPATLAATTSVPKGSTAEGKSVFGQ
jgi:hypothetical protein